MIKIYIERDKPARIFSTHTHTKDSKNHLVTNKKGERRKMNRMSNTVIGFLNILTLISSIVLLGSALWMGRSKTTCEHFLQKPLLILGLAILILSVAGLVGACCDVAWVLWVYLFFMVFIIVALMGLTLFGFIVTSHSGGVVVDGRVYKEFKLEAYHPWLKTRVVDTNYWVTIKTCLLGSVTCSKLALWTPLDYLQKDLSPLQVLVIIIPIFFIISKISKLASHLEICNIKIS